MVGWGSSTWSRRAGTPCRRASSSLISSATPFISAFSAAASSRALPRRAVFSSATRWRWRSCSTRCRRLRRSASRAQGSPAARTWSTSRPRRRSISRTRSRVSTTNLSSSTKVPFGSAQDSTGVECAVLASKGPMKIRKAVFPAAGLGTRFLPATKAQPKEMLPLVDKPIIQYVIEEAVAGGITNIIIVTGRGKNAIEDHFDVSYELEKLLEERGKTDLLEQVRAISSMINVCYVRQGETLGLGHAVLVARDLVGDEPFAVMLGDDIIDAPVPCMRQMVDAFEQVNDPVIAVNRVPPAEISAYGVIDGTP